jgi:cyclopropane fatty-acyl-phospholipid synthase-like methyltransferase
MNNKEHWEKVFATKKENEVSWFQPIPETSIEIFESHNLPKDAPIIDVGSGDSHFIDYLVNKGYRNIYALDISTNALERLKKRLAGNASRVTFISSDILELDTEQTFSYWHDRAVFHFLSTEKQVQSYVSLVKKKVRAGGKMTVATFSESGPQKCSGLEIRQYSDQALNKVFENDFEKIKCINTDHSTPFGTVQNFTFCTFKKAS